MANVKVLSNASLREVGFSDHEISVARAGDGFVGEKAGIKYFAAEMDIKMGDFKMDGSGGVGRMPDQQGER